MGTDNLGFDVLAELMKGGQASLEVGFLAAAIGIVALALGWIVYDLLCRSPLAANEPLLALVGFGYVVATSWVFSLFFSGRGALIHTGALMAISRLQLRMAGALDRPALVANCARFSKAWMNSGRQSG